MSTWRSLYPGRTVEDPGAAYVQQPVVMSGTTKSAAIDLEGMTLTAIECKSGWSTGDISFEAGVRQNGTVPVDAPSISSAAASNRYQISASDGEGLHRYIKVVSSADQSTTEETVVLIARRL
jgi:hypothetical protein